MSKPMIHLGGSFNKPVWLDVSTLNRHALVTGMTGTGKSVFLLNLMFQLAKLGHRFTILDRDGDTARKAWSMLRQFGAVFLRPGEMPFRINPFMKLNGLSGSEYDIGLLRVAEDFARVLAEKIQIADFKEQLRRIRVLMNAIYLCGQRRPNGSYLGLHRLQAAVLFGMNDYWWNHVFNPVRGCLPREREEDILRMVRKSTSKIDDEVQSSINVVDSFQRGELMKEIFRPSGVCIDFHKLANRIVCVDLQDTDSLSNEQADSLGAYMNLAMIDAAKSNPHPNYIILEEADKMLGYSVSDTLRRARKTDTGLIICVQQLASLQNDRVDVASDASGLVGSLVSFQTQNEQELKTLSFIHGVKNFNFQRNVKYQQIHDGYKFIVLNDVSEGRQHSRNWTETQGDGGSQAWSETRSQGKSYGTNKSKTDNQTRTDTENEQESFGESDSKNESRSASKNDGQQAFTDNLGKRHVRNNTGNSYGDSSGSSSGTTHQNSSGRSWSLAEGVANAFGFSSGWNRGKSEGVTDTSSWSRNRGLGGNRTHTRNKTRKTVPLARYRILKQDGGLKDSPEVQIAKMQKALARLPVGWFVFSTLHHAPVLVQGKMRKVPNMFHKRSECWRSPLFFEVPEAETCKLPEIKNSSRSSKNRKPPKTSGS